MATEILSPTEWCDVPPDGWICTRVKGHSGPCAASQIEGAAPIGDVQLSRDAADDAQDAARYRWLKMHSSVAEQQKIMATPWGFWDAFVDAALSSPSPESQGGGK